MNFKMRNADENNVKTKNCVLCISEENKMESSVKVEDFAAQP